jgi:hypothetical protein
MPTCRNLLSKSGHMFSCKILKWKSNHVFSGSKNHKNLAPERTLVSRDSLNTRVFFFNFFLLKICSIFPQKKSNLLYFKFFSKQLPSFIHKTQILLEKNHFLALRTNKVIDGLTSQCNTITLLRVQVNIM